MVKLTLRYLLAYMDDILRPADAREVGRTLSENKAASDLVLRVREVIKRRRLAAPAPLETAPGQNANEMAEFLDNLMSVDEIREFEQLCLDSDELLAEAGACHQILTLVLGDDVSHVLFRAENLTHGVSLGRLDHPVPRS